MITIRYDKKKLCLELEGHAGAGVPGQDLVCCAASILVYTLAANVRRMRSRGWVEEAKIRLTPGDARIICSPYETMRECVTARMDAICLGFWMLEKEYPEFVKVTVL